MKKFCIPILIGVLHTCSIAAYNSSQLQAVYTRGHTALVTLKQECHQLQKNLNYAREKGLGNVIQIHLLDGQPFNVRGDIEAYRQFAQTGACPNGDLRDFNLRNVVARLHNKGIKINLNYADISGADLGNSNLSDAQMNNVIAIKTVFSHTNLTKAQACNANFCHAVFKNAILDDANVSNAHFDYANLKNARIHNALVNKTVFFMTDFMNTDVNETNLTTSCFGTSLNKHLLKNCQNDPKTIQVDHYYPSNNHKSRKKSSFQLKLFEICQLLLTVT